MATRKTSAIILILLSINATMGVPVNNSPFTKEIKLPITRHPVKINNELKSFDRSGLLVSIEPNRENCTSTPFDRLFKFDRALGNGKLLFFGKDTTNFDVLDFKNCASYVNTKIDNGKRDFTKYLNDDIKLGAVVAYHDTFDVFDWYQKTCMPCRYNDKGERLPVEFPLEKEPTGQDPRWAHQHSGYSFDFVKDAFGVKNGYFYVFRYVNKTTGLRILDSKFKTVKQRLYPFEIEAHSLTQQNLTVCYKRNACNRYRKCEYVACDLLDSNLQSTGEIGLHKFDKDDADFVHVFMKVHNVPGGGAIVAMKFLYGSKYLFDNDDDDYHHEDVFVQRIHPNGHIDEPIKFDSVYNEYTYLYDFIFDNGEYCLVTLNDNSKKGSYTLAKCLEPSLPDYSKV